jgi:hypothetical protein
VSRYEAASHEATLATQREDFSDMVAEVNTPLASYIVSFSFFRQSKTLQIEVLFINCCFTMIAGRLYCLWIMISCNGDAGMLFCVNPGGKEEKAESTGKGGQD